MHIASTGISPSHFVTRNAGFFIAALPFSVSISITLYKSAWIPKGTIAQQIVHSESCGVAIGQTMELLHELEESSGLKSSRSDLAVNGSLPRNAVPAGWRVLRMCRYCWGVWCCKCSRLSTGLQSA